MTNKQAAEMVIKDLRSAGFVALLAGGCVRDMLLEQNPKDYDVATDALPPQVTKLFRRTLEVGAQFGVVMVMIGDEQIEVATFRTEHGYSDGRHPSSVEFSNPKDDAARRDFTINGMFYDPIEEKIMDYVNGRQDIDDKIVRTIGIAQERFSEDYLRMLRAIRFSAQLNFKIEQNTFAAICQNAASITKISGERISSELEGVIVHKNRSTGIEMLIESGLSEQIFPDLIPKKIQFGTKALAHLSGDIDYGLALAALFADCKTDFTLESCDILKLSNAQVKHIRYLLDNRSLLLNSDLLLADLKLAMASGYFDDLCNLQTAIQNSLGQAVDAIEKTIARAEPLRGTDITPKPLLNGHDLMSLGAEPGPKMGTLTKELYIAQLGEELQTPDQAKKWAANWLKTHDLT